LSLSISAAPACSSPAAPLQVAQRVRDLLDSNGTFVEGIAFVSQRRSVYVPNIAMANALGLRVATPFDEALVRTAAHLRRSLPAT
jgi:hypothetical protein